MSATPEQTTDVRRLDESTAELERAAVQPGLPAGARYCENCGTALAGPYCSQCGQRHHEHPVHSFWHFVREATEDVTHADSRLWQTVYALLLKPGFLTEEFLAGRRARYLPPVRLYLVISVIFFIVVGLHSSFSAGEARNADNVISFQHKTGPMQAAAGAGTVARMSGRAAAGGAAARPTATASTAAQRQRVCRQSGTYLERHGGWWARFGPRLTQSCLTVITDGGRQRLVQDFERNLERAMFLFIPLLALVMKPLYTRPPRHYVEHLLFFLHNHAFLFVMLAASTLLQMITSSSRVLDPVGTAIAIYVPIYFYLAMRRVYGQGRWPTLGKLTALGVAYFFLGILMFAATFSYSFLML